MTDKELEMIIIFWKEEAYKLLWNISYLSWENRTDAIDHIISLWKLWFSFDNVMETTTAYNLEVLNLRISDFKYVFMRWTWVGRLYLWLRTLAFGW